MEKGTDCRESENSNFGKIKELQGFETGSKVTEDLEGKYMASTMLARSSVVESGVAQPINTDADT